MTKHNSFEKKSKLHVLVFEVGSSEIINDIPIFYEMHITHINIYS